MIKISIVDSSLTIKQREQLNTGSDNFYEVQFKFNSAWAGFDRYAVFYQVGSAYKYQLDLGDDNTITLPGVILKADIPLFIGAYGVKDDTIISTNFVTLPVNSGAYGEDYINPYEPNSDDIVRTLKKKIQYIRVNEEDDDFEYSTDNGQTWNKVVNRTAYEEIEKRINELNEKIEKLSQRFADDIKVVTTNFNNALTDFKKTVQDNYQEKLVPGDHISIVGNVISADGESKYIKIFDKKDFVVNKEIATLAIPKTEYKIDEGYIANAFLINVQDTAGKVLVNRETNFFYSYEKGSDETIYLIVNVDLDELNVYKGKIVIKGE